MVNKKLNTFLNKFPAGGFILYIVFSLGYIILNPADLPVFHLLAGLTMLYLLGLFDDYRDLNIRIKVLFQLLVITYIVVFGIRVSFITSPVDGYIFLEESSIPITIVWIFLLVNAINLLNGIKKLANLNIVIPTIFIALISWDLGRILTARLSLLLICVLIFIKIINKFYNKNMELGNSGTMLAGAILAIISISGALKSVTFISLLLPLIILAVPIINGLAGLYNIFIKKKKQTQMRKKILHHHLIDWGLTEKESRLAYYFTSFLFGILAVLLTNLTTAQSLIITVLVLFLVILALQELRQGNTKRGELQNVKLLKDIQLNLYQIKDIIRVRVINGDLKIVEDELNELEKVISGKIPEYMRKIDEQAAVVKKDEADLEKRINNMIKIIEEVIDSYRLEMENLDYILADYHDELAETVEYLDDLYIRLK